MRKSWTVGALVEDVVWFETQNINQCIFRALDSGFGSVNGPKRICIEGWWSCVENNNKSSPHRLLL